MWRGQLGWTATRIFLPWLPGAIFFFYLFARGTLDAMPAILAGAALLAFTFAMTAITSRWMVSAVRQAAAALGPHPAVPAQRPRRLSPAALAIRPAVSRLDRAWRGHAAAAEARFAAAEAIIA